MLVGAMPSLTRRAVRGPAGSSDGRRPGREPPDQQISLGLVAPYGGIFASGGAGPYSADWETRHLRG
jgi:hypothetical protein